MCHCDSRPRSGVGRHDSVGTGLTGRPPRLSVSASANEAMPRSVMAQMLNQFCRVAAAVAFGVIGMRLIPDRGQLQGRYRKRGYDRLAVPGQKLENDHAARCRLRLKEVSGDPITAVGDRHAIGNCALPIGVI